MFSGVLTAMITPFDSNDRIDWNQLEKFVNEQIEAGISGLVPVGTTGESPTLTAKEKEELIGNVVAWVDHRVPVIAGAGSNSTAAAIESARSAADLGVDATMQVVPYYNRPTQEGMYEHFTAVADRVDLPMMLYNVPHRTGSRLEPSTVLRLARHERIVCLKDAGGDITAATTIIANAPERFSLLSGEDGLTFPLLSIGAQGVISVLSNVFPEVLVKMVSLQQKGEWDAAREIHVSLLPFIDLLFREPSPAPLKAAMNVRFGMSEAVRLPMRLISPQLRKEIASRTEDIMSLV
jgi:4-hydroxy-tetrahydrodipicolinate synthase